MRVVERAPFLNGFENENDPVALRYLEQLKEVHNALHAGTLYIRYVKGDRAGSIAHVKPDPAYSKANDREPAIRFNRSFSNKSDFRFENDRFYVIATWDGRRNQVKESLPFYNQEIEILLDYDGPTVWQKFDAKAAKEEVLKNPDQKDIDGNVLNIGDRVFYINARYGSGFGLERGTIKEFKAVVDSKSTTISTIVVNDQGVESKLNYPESMTCKIQKEV